MATYESIGSSSAITTTTTTTITKPSGVAVGDLLVAGIYCHGRSGGGGVTTLSGWTLQESNGVGSLFLGVYTRTATSDDVAASNYTWTGVTNGAVGGVIYRLSSPGILAGEASGNINGTTGTLTFSGFTPTRANSLFIYFGAKGRWGDSQSQANISTISIATNNPTWTSRASVILDVTNDTHVLGTFTATRAESTATGNVTSTFTDWGVSGQHAGILVAISPQVNGSVTQETKVNAYAYSPIPETGVDAIVDDPTITSRDVTNWTNESAPTTTWTNETL